jgi:hypothetical protein
VIIDGITLDDDFQRLDPYWTGFTATKTYSGSGALLVERAQMQAGMPIVLDSGDYWIKKAKLDQLLAHAQQGLASFNITLPDATVHSVMWDYSNTPISAQPLSRETYPTANSNMVNVQLRFITV